MQCTQYNNCLGNMLQKIPSPDILCFIGYDFYNSLIATDYLNVDILEHHVYYLNKKRNLHDKFPNRFIHCRY